MARAPSRPEDTLTLIYTSGTTGPPKGVELLHRNQMAAVQTVEQTIRFPDAAKVISWLPSAHIAERTAHHYLPIVFGMTVTCCPNPREILAYLPAVRPNWFFAVPRIWEKLKAGMEAYLGLGERNRAWLAGPPARSSSSRPASRCHRTSRPPSPRRTPSCSPACGG